jgi:hypothetical protein
MLQFGASLTDDASSVNYDCNVFMIHPSFSFTLLSNSMNCLNQKKSFFLEIFFRLFLTKFSDEN